MVNTHYKLNTGASIPAIGQYGPASTLACRGLTLVCFPAFGGWGGFTEQERIDFAPTFGEIIKVVIFGASWVRSLTTVVLQEGYRHIDTAWYYRE